LAQVDLIEVDATLMTSANTPAVPETVTRHDPAITQLAELEALRKKAVEEGRLEGLALAREAAEKADKESRAAQRKFMQTLDQAFRQWRNEQEEQVADIAYVATCRLLGEAYANKDSALAAVRHVLSQVQPDSTITVQLHPQDAELLAEDLANSAGSSFEQLKIEGSAKVEVGGCRIVAADGVFDARLETQLGILRERLTLARAAWRSQST
jgi:flagellar biosynthesis/type III secretory pathway protein FliH